MTDIKNNLRSVRQRIDEAAERAKRDPGEIMLVAVSKTFPVQAVLEAYENGVRNFGENRVEEAVEKIPAAREQLKTIERSDESTTALKWHMIGHLQHRKIKDAVDLFDFVQSVDSVPLAQRLENRAFALGKGMPILLEVNVSGETAKYGFAPAPRENFFSDVAEILKLPHLDAQGLMTMAPIAAQADDARAYFSALRAVRDELHLRFPERAWQHLSMGMTDDFEAAIAEGATIVRIGRAIFGERQ